MKVLTPRQKCPVNKSINNQISHREVTRFLGKQYFEQNMVHLTLSPYTKLKWLTRQDRQSRITLSLTQLFVFVLSIHMGWHFGRCALPWQGKKHGSLSGKLIGKSGKKEAGQAKCLLMKAPGEWEGGEGGRKKTPAAMAAEVLDMRAAVWRWFTSEPDQRSWFTKTLALC